MHGWEPLSTVSRFLNVGRWEHRWGLETGAQVDDATHEPTLIFLHLHCCPSQPQRSRMPAAGQRCQEVETAAQTTTETLGNKCEAIQRPHLILGHKALTQVTGLIWEGSWRWGPRQSPGVGLKRRE